MFYNNVVRYSSFEGLIQHHKQLGSRATLLSLVPVLPSFLLRKPRMTSWSKYIEYCKFQWKSVRLQDWEENTCQHLPEIDVLIVVAGEDIKILAECIEHAIRNSKNQISKITIICREAEIETCEVEILEVSTEIPIEIINENNVIDVVSRKLLLEYFPNRYGWVLQQTLATQWILESTAKGVLLLDADTFVIRPVTWLERDGRQKMSCSTELNSPYYVFLGKLFKNRFWPEFTFVTHHMLFQPNVLREIFREFKIENVANLIEFICANHDRKAASPVCVEFELYAQGVMLLFPNLFDLRKFSNLGLPRTGENLNKLESGDLEKEYSNSYNSVSLHHYIRK